MNLEVLPPRPFAIGYVRAFAQALGANGDLAVAQFKQDSPSPDEALKAPLGVTKDRDPRLSWLAGVGVVVITSVVLWNVAQHAVAHDGAPSPPVPVSNVPQAAALGAKGPVALAAAAPGARRLGRADPLCHAGHEQGPRRQVGADSAGARLQGRAQSPRRRLWRGGQPIDPHGAGARKPHPWSSAAPTGPSISPASSKRESPTARPRAWPAWTIDVSDPQAFKVTVNGQVLGPLEAAQTPIAKLTAKALAQG